jgi:ubiquinone/menaquinone biosynthesis C-methylase UbiE
MTGHWGTLNIWWDNGMSDRETKDNTAPLLERTFESTSFLARPGIHTEWENAYLNPGLDALYDAIFARIHGALVGQPDPQLLDAGCGYCHHSLRIARHGARITGLDFSPAALNAATGVIEAAGAEHRISLFEGSILEIPFAAGAFDNVLCWGVLMHIPAIETALAELCRVVAPGGRLIIGENSCASLDCRVFEPTLRLVKRLLGRRVPNRRRTGFGIEEWTSVDDGGLMVRKTDIGKLVAFCETQGLRLVDRFGGQFTETHAHARFGWLVQRIQRFNERRFASQGRVGGFHGQVLVFERPAS